jgi:hypothetical protein
MIASGRFLASSIGLLIVDEHQDRVGDQASQRDEIGAGRFSLSPEQLVDFFVAGDSVVMRQQGIAVRLCTGGNLCADLASGACLGLNDHWLFDDRLKR